MYHGRAQIIIELVHAASLARCCIKLGRQSKPARPIREAAQTTSIIGPALTEQEGLGTWMDGSSQWQLVLDVLHNSNITEKGVVGSRKERVGR